MSITDLAIRTGISRYDIEDAHDELSPEQWDLYCEELLLYSAGSTTF